jgi:hypothetical protein
MLFNRRSRQKGPLRRWPDRARTNTLFTYASPFGLLQSFFRCLDCLAYSFGFPLRWLPRLFHRLHPRSGCRSRDCVSARDFDPDHRAHPQTAQNGFLTVEDQDLALVVVLGNPGIGLQVCRHPPRCWASGSLLTAALTILQSILDSDSIIQNERASSVYVITPGETA